MIIKKQNKQTNEQTNKQNTTVITGHKHLQKLELFFNDRCLKEHWAFYCSSVILVGQRQTDTDSTACVQDRNAVTQLCSMYSTWMSPVLRFSLPLVCLGKSNELLTSISLENLTFFFIPTQLAFAWMPELFVFTTLKHNDMHLVLLQSAVSLQAGLRRKQKHRKHIYTPQRLITCHPFCFFHLLLPECLLHWGTLYLNG